MITPFDKDKDQSGVAPQTPRVPGRRRVTNKMVRAISGRSRLRAPVHVPVQKWEKINLPFIKRQRFNGLRFWVWIHRRRPIAPKRGIDNFPANL